MPLEGSKRLCKLDTEILTGLYEYRALTTEQIARKFGISMPYTYKKLYMMRKKKLLHSEPISGYLNKQRSQGKYHRISETGISCLKKQGMFVERQAYQLKIDKYHLPYVLMTNDLLVDLEPHGWELSDSRDTKARFRLNRSDNIQGMLLNTHTRNEYGIYILNANMGPKNLQKTIREVGDYDQINDFLLFTSGSQTFETIVKALLEGDDGKVVAKRHSIKVLPHVFGRKYLSHFDDEDKVLRFAVSELGVSFKERLKGPSICHDGLDTIVWHEGEEKYFVNLLDTDLKKIHHMLRYRKESYREDGRKLLVLTHVDLHSKLLKEIFHIDYLAVHPSRVVDYLAVLN